MFFCVIGMFSPFCIKNAIWTCTEIQCFSACFPTNQSYRILSQSAIFCSPNAGFSPPNADFPLLEEEYLHKTSLLSHKNQSDHFVLTQDL